MITIKSKTRALIEIKNVNECELYLKKISKNWRSLTPLVNDRLLMLINSKPFYKSIKTFYLLLRKDILEMRSGTFSIEHYINIFGWTKDDAISFLAKKGEIFKTSCGGLTPGMKDFWIKHHNMSEEEAINAVSNTQRKLSVRKKKTTINQPTSINFYLHRGLTEEQALKEQSLVQKKRRNNCVAYWLHRGYSLEDAKREISELQKKRSQLSIDYWLHRGYSLEDAQKESLNAQKNTCTGRISKVSQKFFDELIELLEKETFNKDEFLYGKNEQVVYISDRRRIYLDFLHTSSKAVIEFDGKYWHENRQQEDLQRDTFLISLGYKILRIPETNNKHKWNKYLEEAVNFIKENNNATIS